MSLSETTFSRFTHQHKAIKNYIDELPPQAIYNRLNPGKYSIHETIAYLTRYHIIFRERLSRMIREVNPFFELYKPHEDTEYQFCVAKTTGALLHQLYRVRQDIAIQLQELEQEQLSRSGTHAALGKMDIRQWLEFFLLHEANQLFRIFKLSGSFWSMESLDSPNVIYLPGLTYQMDEMAG